MSQETVPGSFRENAAGLKPRDSGARERICCFLLHHRRQAKKPSPRASKYSTSRGSSDASLRSATAVRMSVSRPDGGGTQSPCSLTDSRKDLETPKNSLQQPQKPGVAPAAARAAPVAFATDDFADLVWPSAYETISAEDEEAEVLNDLLHLGLELGDLECVFGDTNCASCSDINSSSSIHVTAAGEGRDEDAGLVVGEDVASHAKNYDGGAAEEFVLLDADLQDALLSLRHLEAESTGDHALFTDSSVQETSIDYSTCGNTSDDTGGCCDHETVGCWAFDTTASGPLTPSAGDSDVALDVEHCTTPSPSATPSKEDPDHVIVFGSPTNSCRQDAPGVFVHGEDLLADFDATGAVMTMHQEAAAAAEGTAPFPAAVVAEAVAGGTSPSGSDGRRSGEDSWKPNHADEEVDARTYFISAGVAVAPTSTLSTSAAAAAAAASPASPAAVPTRLLDAIDLWESANAHAIAKKKAAAVTAAAAAREHARATRAKKGCNTASIAKSRNKKKKNEFGKRRRSSGGGDQDAPVLETPKTAAAGAAGATAGNTKGKSHGRAKGKEKGKKVDPLVRIRDARHLSRKPLIVQWLKSDGCDSDEEAEAALGKAVGSLSAISRYWSRGG